MNKKRLASLTLAMTLALTACGGGTSDGNSGNNGQGGDAQSQELTEFYDYQLQSLEMETFCYLHSEEAVNGRVLQNLVEGLLTQDAHANIKPLIATSYESNEDMSEWTFTIRDDVKWVDVNCNVKADLTAQDFATGMEWVLNYWKNDAKNVSMLVATVKGAQEYYDWTKELDEATGKATKATDAKFMETVGIEIVDPTHIKYTLLQPAPYFPTVIRGTCGYPLSQAQIDEMGVEGFKEQNNQTMWYNGPYVLTEYIMGNSKTFTPNTAYWDTDCKRFDTVTVKMVEDGNRDDEMFMNGELDRCDVSEANLRMIYNDESHPFHDNLVQVRASAAHYQFQFNYNKLNADGTEDTAWNTAVANENFRKAFRYAIDLSPYWARFDFIDPDSNRIETFTTPDLVKFSDGKDYVDRVWEILGQSKDTYRWDSDDGAKYVAAAKEELTAAGVTLPIKADFFVKAGDQAALDGATVLKECIEKGLEGLVTLNIGTYVSSQTQEITAPHLHSFVFNGWIADYQDPENFINQMVTNNENAYYANRIVYSNNAQGAAKEQWDEFSKLCAEANAIVDDLDARYEAQAQAEAYMLEHALIVPLRSNTAWSMTKANTYSYPRGSTKYVNWETQTEPYTSEQYAQLKAEFEAETK